MEFQTFLGKCSWNFGIPDIFLKIYSWIPGIPYFLHWLTQDGIEDIGIPDIFLILFLEFHTFLKLDLEFHTLSIEGVMEFQTKNK